MSFKELIRKVKLPQLTYATFFEMIIGGSTVFTAQTVLLRASETDPKSTITAATLFAVSVLVLTKFKNPTEAILKSDNFKLGITTKKEGMTNVTTTTVVSDQDPT